MYTGFTPQQRRCDDRDDGRGSPAGNGQSISQIGWPFLSPPSSKGAQTLKSRRGQEEVSVPAMDPPPAPPYPVMLLLLPRLDSGSEAPELLGGTPPLATLATAYRACPVFFEAIKEMSEMRKPCITPGCGLMVSHPSPRRTRCAECEARYQANRNRRPERAVYRDPAYKAAVRWGVCHLCGRPGADTRDHVVPVSKGGTNHPTNLKPAHSACNTSKGGRGTA